MIWIDKETGTWGSVDGLVLIENPTETTLHILDGLSDSEVSEFGEEYGTPLTDLID